MPEPNVTDVNTGGGSTEPAPLTHSEHEQIVQEATEAATSNAAEVAAAAVSVARMEAESAVATAEETAEVAAAVAFNAEEQCLDLASKLTSLTTTVQNLADQVANLTPPPPSSSETTTEIEVPASDDAAEPTAQAPTRKRRPFSFF